MATVLTLIGRLVFAALFLMAAAFKVSDLPGTATYIAAAGFPIPTVLAVLALAFEVALVAAFATGAFFREAALAAAAYVVFLAFAFHGPSKFAENPNEFGFFVDHFTFMAGLFFAAAHGPGRVLALNVGLIGRER